MTEHRGAGKFIGISVLVATAMLALVVRLLFLHLGWTDQNRAAIVRQSLSSDTLVVGRGRILDGSAASNTLAINVTVKDVAIDPTMIAASNRAAVVTRLSTELGLAAEGLSEAVSRTNRQYVRVARHVPEPLATRVAARKIPGLILEDALQRSYPQGAFMCHVIGFANEEGVGSAGIELRLEKYLKSSPGLVETMVDARRRELYTRRIRSVAPQEGADVTLTIDQNLQYMLEKGLDNAMERNHAQAAWGIIQRVKTGEILGMASRPAFDLNRYRHATDVEKLNRAIGTVYEPGSTFKVGVIAAALNEGIVTPEQVFDCENGRWLYQKRILRDYHPYGYLDVADILKKSSNIGAAKIAIQLGNERLDRYLRAFGIGSRLGIDLPGEESGILWPVAKWSPISSSRIAIGQGVAVTGLQMLGILCGIANDGRVMRPYVVRQVVDATGAVVYRGTPRMLSQAIRPETAALMRRLLARVTEAGGTGTQAAVDGFKVAGKTGTAQKPIRGIYSETDYMASFAGFLPADDPEIGMIIVVDTPQPFHTGGAVAAPVFGEVADQAVRYLGVMPPSYALTSAQP